MSKFRYILFISSFIIFFTSCSKYNKLLKGNDNEKKFEAAEKYYKQEDFYKAQQLLEDLLTYFRGTEKAEKVYYYYAYCYYGQQDYVMASYHFKNFAMTFPQSSKAEECLFMSAYCYYFDSPIYSLDQTNTYKAINELQLFVNKYPKSSKVEECNRIIDELRHKLELKAFEIAKLYLKTEEYKAAIVAFDNVIKDFPDTKFREEIIFLTLKANYFYAKNSIENKKQERLKLTVAAYKQYTSKYPQGIYIKEVEAIYQNVLKEIKNKNYNI
ncbi:MAG: outer membrane protein assembly factor BamD [Bacteroidales bacterium]|jgi:outer membrane protein assembly factor BamD